MAKIPDELAEVKEERRRCELWYARKLAELDRAREYVKDARKTVERIEHGKDS